MSDNSPMDFFLRQRQQAASLLPRPVVPPRFQAVGNRPPGPDQLVPAGQTASKLPTALPVSLVRGAPQPLRLPQVAQARIPYLPTQDGPPPISRFTRAFPGVPGTAQSPQLQGFGDIFDDLKTQFEPANLVDSVELNTTLYDFKSVQPLKPQPGPTYGSMFMRFLKPQIRVNLSPVFGKPLAPIVVAPWGVPVEDKTTQALLVVGTAGVLGLAAYGLKKLLLG